MQDDDAEARDGTLPYGADRRSHGPQLEPAPAAAWDASRSPPPAPQTDPPPLPPPDPAGPGRPAVRDRRLVRREPSQGDDPGEERADRAEWAVGPGEPPRRAPHQRGRDRAGREGPLEQPDPGRGFPVPR